MRRLDSFLFWLVATSPLYAQSLEDRYGEAFRDLPEELIFECAYDGAEVVPVFNRAFVVPDNYEANHDLTSFQWLVPMSNGLFTTPFSRIVIERIEVMITQSYTWPAVSEHNENALGARISLLEPKEDAELGTYTLFLVRNDEYIYISSLVPINWTSILECFRD